jgi:hypothetical protein
VSDRVNKFIAACQLLIKMPIFSYIQLNGLIKIKTWRHNKKVKTTLPIKEKLSIDTTFEL